VTTRRLHDKAVSAHSIVYVHGVQRQYHLSCDPCLVSFNAVSEARKVFKYVSRYEILDYFDARLAGGLLTDVGRRLFLDPGTLPVPTLAC
jgi:hypothetical protein